MGQLGMDHQQHHQRAITSRRLHNANVSIKSQVETADQLSHESVTSSLSTSRTCSSNERTINESPSNRRLIARCAIHGNPNQDNHQKHPKNILNRNVDDKHDDCDYDDYNEQIIRQLTRGQRNVTNKRQNHHHCELHNHNHDDDDSCQVDDQHYDINETQIKRHLPDGLKHQQQQLYSKRCDKNQSNNRIREHQILRKQHNSINVARSSTDQRLTSRQLNNAEGSNIESRNIDNTSRPNNATTNIDLQRQNERLKRELIEHQLYRHQNQNQNRDIAIKASHSTSSNPTIIKFISQIYFLIHLAAIISLLLHHKVLIAQPSSTSTLSQQASYLPFSAPLFPHNDIDNIDFRFKRTTTPNETSVVSQETIVINSNAESNDILVRLFGYAHARRFLYYALAYLLATSAIILITIRLYRYINNRLERRPSSSLNSSATRQTPSFSYQIAVAMETQNSFYHRMRLDCTPVLIACIALGLLQLGNIGYQVASRLDLFAVGESRWPIYLAALHFCFVSLLTQYILGWVTTKHEERCRQKVLQEECNQHLRLITRLQLKQQQQHHLRSAEPISKPIRIGIPASLALSTSPSTSSIGTSTATSASLLNSTTSSLDHFMLSSNEPLDDHPKLRISRGNKNNASFTCSSKTNYHPIRHGLHNVALAHILATHLLLWLMDLNSIDLLQSNWYHQDQATNERNSVNLQSNNNHKVIYTVNYPAAPKTTSSRSLGGKTPITISNSSTRKQGDNDAVLFRNQRPLWTPPDESTLNHHHHQFQDNMILIPITPTRYVTLDPTSTQPTTSTTTTKLPVPPIVTTTTTTTSPTMIPTTSGVPAPATPAPTTTSTLAPPITLDDLRNFNGSTTTPATTALTDGDQNDNEQTRENQSTQTNLVNRKLNHLQRLPPAPEVEHPISDSQSDDALKDRVLHRTTVQAAITPPSPINWADSASEQAPRHELRDSGDLSQVVPARKRRVQGELPATIRHEWRSQTSTAPAKPTPSTTITTSKESEKPTQRQTSPAPPIKKKTAFKPIMTTSRHINLTTNMPSTRDYNQNQVDKQQASIDTPTQQHIDRSVRRSPKMTSLHSDSRAFPSLETSEPAAWPSTNRGTSSTRASGSTTELPQQSRYEQPSTTKGNNINNSKLRQANNRKTNRDKNNNFEIDEISQVIPVSQTQQRMRNPNREQRAMVSEQQQMDQKDQDPIEEDPKMQKMTTTSTSVTTTMKPSDQAESVEGQTSNAIQAGDSDMSQVEPETANSLDSQLPPVPNYDNGEELNQDYNNGTDYATQPIPTADQEQGEAGSDPSDSEEGSENDEELQQKLSGQARIIDSRRLSVQPQSQPLVSEAAPSLPASNSSKDAWPLVGNSAVDDKTSMVAMLDYLRCIVSQFYILLAAILLNLWLDGLFQGNSESSLSPRPVSLMQNRQYCQKSYNLDQLAGSSKQMQLQFYLGGPAKAENALTSPGGEWGSSSTSGNSAGIAANDPSVALFLHNRQQHQVAKILQLAAKRHTKLTPRQLELMLLQVEELNFEGDPESCFEDSSCQSQLTACSLFAGLCIVAAAIAAVAINIELVSILVQCLIQTSTILACLIGLCFIWRARRRWLRLANQHETLSHGNPRVSPKRQTTNVTSSQQISSMRDRHRRLWQRKSLLYLEPTFTSRFARSSKATTPLGDSTTSSNLTRLAAAAAEATTTTTASGRQCFHYLFLLAAYYMGVSVALNLGSQYSMQQVFPQQVIQFVASHQQQKDQDNPVSLNYINFLFHCVLALKGFLLILQVTIQTILIRCSCKTNQAYQSRMRHIYTFLMFANLSLWAMEICCSQSKQQQQLQLNSLENNRLATTTTTTTQVPAGPSSHADPKQDHLMSLDGFIQFACSIVTLSHLYHGLVFI